MEKSITNTVFDFLSGGGEMGKLIRSKDWSETPLGSPDTWPQSLRTTVSLCIASNFPIAIAWGPNRVQIYNDGYLPITGDMHPVSMGQDFKECWLSAWPVIGQAFEEASLGQARFLENQHIFLDRYGYKEETFFTFSFSPILDESGSVGGLFHPVIELTQQTLAERRLNVLRVAADSTVNAKTVDEASSLIMECLKEFALDLPFVLLYAIGADGKEAKLQGSVGVERDSALAPAKINLDVQHPDSWPFTEVIQNEKAVLVEELGKIFGTFNCGPYAEPPEQALVFPVTLHGTAHNNYFLVAGVSSRRNLDEKYRLFYELLAASVTNTLTKARAYDEERKKAEALAEIDKAKTVFFSNISHEFRTPLTLILSPLEELLNQQKNNFSESEKQIIESAHRNAMRLLKLVNTLLDFSRIECGRQQANFSLVDIVAHTKNLASNFRSVVEKAGLKLIIKADSIIQPVYLDKQMWEKIVFNLLSNAFKYTLEGSITVALSAENDFAVLKVTDTGAGIPENELPEMFERFHRVLNVRGRTYEGTGIGLSLVKELLKMHQGTIHVESKLNEGSVFTVRIPAGKKHIADHQILKTAIDSDEISSTIYVNEIETLFNTGNKEIVKTSSAKEKTAFPIVLVVDDNADMRDHISSILSNSFDVITANNGMDALHKMKETIPALVLSDIMMPVMDGIGLLKEIKGNKSTANIPVILLTARAGEESRIEGWETGAEDYLVKPFSAKELLSRVQAQIKMEKLRLSLEGNMRNLFLNAPALICLLRGPQHVFELANDMYLELIGNRDILGKAIRKALPEVEGQGLFELLDNVYLTGEPFIGNEMPAQLDKGNGKLEEVYFNFVYQPSRNSEGIIDGILVHGVDVTEQVVSRKKIEENAKQQAFLLKLSDALRPLGNPVDIEEAVTKIALDFMDADWCHYVTLEEDNLIIQRGASRDGFASLAGVYPISSFTLFKDVLTTGIPSIINDVHTTDILDEDLKQLCIQLQNIAIVIVPVIKNGKPLGLLVLVQSKPRKWTDSEVQLTIETAERTWAAVERAKAEEALSKSEEKYRSLFNSIDEGVSTIEIIFDENEKAVDFRFLESNPAMTKATGLTSEIHGKTAKEVLPNLEEFWLETYGRVVKTGEPIRFDYTSEELNSNWFEVHAYKVGNKQSRKIITVYNNITDRKIEEEKQTYILNLSDAIKELIDPVDIQLTACRILGEHVKVNRVLYGEVMDEEQIIINNNYVNGVAPINATLDAEQFGRNVIDAFKRNEKVIFSDINTDPGYTEEEKQSFLFLDVVANIGIGLIKGGRWVATFGMHYNAPRNWTAAEIWLLEETAERTWAAIERAKVEQALRKSEEKYRNLFTSIDQGFALCELVRNKEGKGIDVYVLEVNPSYEKQAGVNMEMVVGKTILQSFPALDKWWIETFTAVVNFHSPVVFEHYFESTHRWFAINAYPAEKDRFAILFSEITERKQAEAKIAESENRYHNMIYSSPSLIAIFKGEDMIIDIANDAILESWGKGKDIIGKTLISVMPEIVEQGFEEMLLNVYKTGEPFHAIEMPVTLIKSGKPELMHYTFVYQALYNAGGEIEGVAIIANEVTRQVELNKKIKESEQYFRQLTDTVPAIIWISEPDGSCTYLNKNWYSYTGQTEAEAKGFGWLDATHPDDKDETGRILLEANVQKKPFTASYRLKVKNRGYRWVIDRGSPKYSEDGVFEGMIGTVEDVHEEKLAAEKVRDSEKQFSTLANNIQNLAWIADGEGWIYWYNQRWYDYTGTTLEEMKGWGWQKVHHPDHIERILEISKKLWITNAPFELTFPLRRYDGEYRWFLTRGAPISDENGKIISWIGTNTDIEEQKNFSEQLEEKVKERTIQLNKLNGNLEEKNIQLENMNKELEAFTYVSSHDLQEPLRKIQTFAGRIIATEKEQLSDTAKDYFTRMQDSATRMQTLIQDLLAFSRISTSERKFEKTDLSKIVEEVAAEFKEAMEEKNAIIISGEMCGANIIPFQFRQLMHNLIGNAIKFSKQDVPSRIIVNSEFVTGSNSPFANRDACHVSVSDNGIGFEKHFSEKIFGVFQRLHGKNKYAGTGIGLAIVKKIVDNHNGIITAEGELGKGAAFHIYFPD